MNPRLLFVLPDLGVGGAQPMNLRLARHLVRKGYSVRIVTLFKRSLEPLDGAGLEIVRLDAKGWGKLMLPGRLARLAQESDIVIGGVEDAATNYGWLAAALSRKPFVAWTHISFHEHLKRRGPFDRWVSLRIRHRLRWVVFPSQGALDSMRRALGGQPSGSHWQVIANFIDPPPSRPSSVPDSEIYRKPVLIGIGRLAEQKAFERLIRAHAALRRRGLDHHLVILGEGPHRRELEAEVHRLGVADSAFLPGHVDNVMDWLGHATVFALCSRYEGFGLVLLEALSCGVPSVAMDCPAGPREILQDGKAGLLVPDGDEAAFQEALYQLLSDTDLRKKFAAKAQKRAVHYAPEEIVPQWELLFKRVRHNGGT